MKNIPIPGKLQYQKRLVEKSEHFINRFRWFMFFLLNPGASKQKQTFGFKSTERAPPIREMAAFEEEFFDLIRNIEFRYVPNNFQTKLKEDIKKIHQTNEIIVSADKTQNKYKIPVDTYKTLLLSYITRDYKKVVYDKVNTTNKKAAKLTDKLEISDRVDKYVESEAYVTIKDTKPNFPSRIQCRLINPAKSNVGQISKIILEKTVQQIKVSRASLLWRSSQEVIHWFQALENKESLTFFKFDVVSFYPSISKKLFSDTIQWAKQQKCKFSAEDIKILYNAR